MSSTAPVLRRPKSLPLTSVSTLSQVSSTHDVQSPVSKAACAAPTIADYIVAAKTAVVRQVSNPAPAATAICLSESESPQWINMSARESLDARLIFQDAQLERRFVREQYNKYSRAIRLRIVIAALIWSALAIADVCVNDSGVNVTSMAITRLVLGAAAAAIALASFIPHAPTLTMKLLQCFVVIMTMTLGGATIAFSTMRNAEMNAVDAAVLTLLGSTTATMFHLPIITTISCQILLLLAYIISTALTYSYSSINNFIINIIIIFISFILTSIISYNFEYQKRKLFFAKQKLNYDEQKTLILLKNMLPQQVIADVKKHRIVYETYNSVSVLFSHIYNFDALTSEMTAENVINLLNVIFSQFDRLTDEYGVYKVETIGDVYLVSAGVPATHATDDHASLLALFSFAMMDAIQAPEIQSYSAHRRISLKVGIHSGGIVSGVVGRKYPRYRLMGDTINTASRMSTTCREGHVQLSHDTYKCLSPNFICQFRGHVAVKGKGEMATFYLRHVLYQQDKTPHRISLTESEEDALQRADSLLEHFVDSRSPLPRHESPVMSALYSRAITSDASAVTYVFHGYNDDESVLEHPLVSVGIGSSIERTNNPTFAYSTRKLFALFRARSSPSRPNEADNNEVVMPMTPLTDHNSAVNRSMSDLMSIAPTLNRVTTPSTDVFTSPPTLDRMSTPSSASSTSRTSHVIPKLNVKSNSASQLTSNLPLQTMPPMARRQLSAPPTITPRPLIKNKESVRILNAETLLLSESAVVDELLHRTVYAPWNLSFASKSASLERRFYQRRSGRLIKTTFFAIASLMIWMIVAQIYTTILVAHEPAELIKTWTVLVVAELIGATALLIIKQAPVQFIQYESIIIGFVWISMSVCELYVLYELQDLLLVYGIIVTALLMTALLFFVGISVALLNIICTAILIDYIVSAAISADEFPLGMLVLLVTWTVVMTTAFTDEYSRRIDFLLLLRLREEGILAKQLADAMLPVDVTRALRHNSIVYQRTRERVGSLLRYRRFYCARGFYERCGRCEHTLLYVLSLRRADESDTKFIRSKPLATRISHAAELY